MAHLATKRISYWGQLGILTAFTGVGLLIGTAVSLLPLLGTMGLEDLKSISTPGFMDKLLQPSNASALRWMNSISTLFLFFLPAMLYAYLCHKKAALHLGLRQPLQLLPVGVVLLIMFASLPMVSALQELTEMLPWSKASRITFQLAEDAYNRQVAVMARMDNFTDYLLSLLVIALLPALFEETLFRGGLQNLLSRWFKMPVLAIVVTAIVFSAIHGSYLGFLSRFALGFVLGWIFYRTGNLWLSIIGHFFNNAFAITVLYITTKPGQKPDMSKMDEGLPLWAGLASMVLVVALFYLFDKVSVKEIDQPGEEKPMPGVAYTDNPFEEEPVSYNNPGKM